MPDNRFNNNRNKLMHDSGQLKQHYKMYKAGRSWLYAGISLLTFGAGVMFSNLNVHADDAITTTTVADSTSSASNIQSSAVALSASTSQVSLSSSADLSASASSSQSTNEQSTVADAVSEASSSAVTSSSTADGSTGLSTASSATSATTAATSSAAVSTAQTSVSSATQVSNSSVDSSGSATSSSASVQDQTSVALAQLPTGTTVETLADGTVQFDLPVTATQQDLNNAKTLLAGMNISPVVVTAKDASASGPKTWGTTSDSTSQYGAYGETLGNIANALTMGDFAWITAVGTGNLNGQSASLSEINAYFKALAINNPNSYRLLNPTTGLLNFLTSSNTTPNQTDIDEANAASFMYYWFLGADNSFVSSYMSYLSGLSNSQLIDMAQTALNDSNNIDVTQLLEQNSNFIIGYYYPSGTETSVKNDAGIVYESSTNTSGYWNIPSSFNSIQSTYFAKFTNTVVSMYIAAIVPGAESYIINNVLPAVNTVSDTTGLTNYTDLDSILSQIGEQSYQLAKDLMTVDDNFDLSTIISHIPLLYENSTLISELTTTKDPYLGRFVGAFTSGSTDGNTLSATSENAVAFDNFSLFNPLYVDYSEVLVKILYGYAMLGKYEMIDAIYNNESAIVEYMSSISNPSQIDPKKIENIVGTSNSIPNDVATEVYQQGVWDAYAYIYPFVKAAQEDSEDPILESDYSSNDAYQQAVWNRVNSEDTLKDTSGENLELDTTTDPNNPNPHDVSNSVSAQTLQYLVDFYTNNVSSENTEVMYNIQPVSRTVVYQDSTKNIILSVTDTSISTPVNGISGIAGSVVDVSKLPTVSGYSVPTQSQLENESVYIPENGGTINVPYLVNSIVAGTVTVTSSNAPDDATYTYTIVDAKGSTVSSGSGSLKDNPTISLNLDVGETLTVDASSTTSGVKANPAQFVIPYEMSGMTYTFDFSTPVNYTIQPQIQYIDSDGNIVSKDIGASSTVLSGYSGANIDTTQLPTVAGYTAPTFNDTDTDTTNNTPTIPTSGGVIKVAYTANEQSFTVSQTGAPSGSTAGFSYTINGGSAQTGTYGTAINAHVGDVIAITPDTITNYDASLNADTITLTANNTGSATVTYSQKNQTFTVTQTGAPTGTTGFTYTVNGETPQNGTYGTAVLAHAGDVIVVTPGVVANYNVTPATQTVTLSEDVASAISVVYVQQAQTFTVNATGIPSGTTTNFTYTINDGAAQTGTYGTAINAHVGDVIVITPGTIANYNVNPMTNTLTLTNSAAGTATFAYTIATQTIAMTLNKAIVANYDGSTTAAKFLQTDIQNYSDATSNSALSWLAWGNTGIATYFNGDGSSNKAAFIAGLADMASDANFNNYFTVTSDGSLCGQYSYSLTSAGITALNALLASTTGNKYQVSFASEANTSSIFVANALIIRQNQHVYDGTSADSNASQTTAMIYYYDSGTNSIRDYSLTAGWFLPEDFVNNGNVDTSQVGTYAFSLADGNDSAKEYLTNNELNKYTANTINPLSLDYATASFVVTPRAATVTPTITAISKAGVPTVSLTFNVPSVTGSADITSTSSIAPKYKDALISGTDYTVSSSNGVMTVTLTDAGLQKINAANSNYAITGVVGQANVSTINFQYTDSTNGNVVYIDTVYGLSSDQTSQNYGVDLTNWTGGLSYTLAASQVATIPYTFGTNKNVTILLDHYVANVVVSVKDTNGNTLKDDQTVTLDPLDDTKGGTAANVAVDGYPTSQVSSIVFTYTSGDRNPNNISELVATVDKSNNTFNMVFVYPDGHSESQTGDVSVEKGQSAGEELSTELASSYTLFSFGNSGTFEQDDESDFLGIATITVTYFAQLTATVKFVDDDEKDADGNSKDITGQDQTIIGFVGDAGQNQAINIPAGYGLASTQPDLNGNVTVSGTNASYTGVVNGDDTDNATIHLVHLTTPVDAGSTTVGTDDYAATHLALTVQVISSDPTHLTITDGSFTRTYTRTVYVDDITGEYVGGSDWQYDTGGFTQPTASLSTGYGYNVTGNIGDENTPNIKTYTNVDDLFKNWISTDGSSDITAFLANVADGGTAQLTYTANVSSNVKDNPAPSDTTDPEYENTHKTYTFTVTGHIDNAVAQWLLKQQTTLSKHSVMSGRMK